MRSNNVLNSNKTSTTNLLNSELMDPYIYDNHPYVKIKVDGVWKDIADMYILINGEWRHIVEEYILIGKKWKRVI